MQFIIDTLWYAFVMVVAFAITSAVAEIVLGPEVVTEALSNLFI